MLAARPLRGSLRETLTLILFGIVLVPIAAKRAQDARRGYHYPITATSSTTGNTTEQHLASPLLITTTTTTITIHDNTDATLSEKPIPIAALLQQQQQQNDTVPTVVSSAPPRSGVTISFGRAGVSDDREPAAAGSLVRATPAPSSRAAAASADGAEVLGGGASPTTAAAPALGKVSSDAGEATSGSSKGRWTLIWMASAIAAVAGLMSLC